MDSFYRRWLRSDEKINKTVKNKTVQETQNTDSVQTPTIYKNQTDIVFENDSLILKIEKGFHKRQKNFRLQDHMFYFKIESKSPNDAFPLLGDILDFLHAGFLHLLDNIKTFYNPEDKNIAYLCLYQEPMINGLNTGGFNLQV